MPANTVVIVTGANRGIGQAICKLILSQQHSTPLTLIATSRQGENLGFSSKSNDTSIKYAPLDISDPASITAFKDTVANQSGIKVLINNAGVNLDARYTVANVKKTLDVNYRGTLQMCQAFGPLVRPEGRIVNLSSVASSLKPYSETIQNRFRDPKLTLEKLEALVQEFERSVEEGSETESGFVATGRAYSFSKACVNAFTRILARENADLIINCCCPGWVKTDMGQLVGRPPKTPEDGAKIPVRLALGDIGGVSGEYWANASIRSKEEGEVQQW